MHTSSNPEVQTFLDELESFDSKKYQIIQKVREVVQLFHPHSSERIMYGGIMFTAGQDFGGVYPSKNHVSFEFSQGYLLEDPDNILEGSGKFRRHLKFKSLKDIEAKDLNFFIDQF